MASLLRAVRDDAYMARKHTITGREVLKDLAKGKDAHVFNDATDFNILERAVWRQGTFQGQIGAGPRAQFQRFVWRSPTPIGKRIQTGKPDVPAFWVEIKGKVVGQEWIYHLVPRIKPAS